MNDRPITFLDTPGHAAFTSMRARGAQVTDIAVIVVAADDGIMPRRWRRSTTQKRPAFSIIVAINKMDKPHANPDKVMQELTEHELVPEEWGGDVPCIPVSAKSKQGIGDLLEMIQLMADTSELKANPNKLAKGYRYRSEARQGPRPCCDGACPERNPAYRRCGNRGTSVGVCASCSATRAIKWKLPVRPCRSKSPDWTMCRMRATSLTRVEDERLAKELVDKRKFENKQEQFSAYEKVTLDNLFSHISQGDIKELPIIVKADVQGSVEAVEAVAGETLQ